MILESHHAEIPRCTDCTKWVYEPDNGWKPTLRLGQRLLRGNSKPPCWKCPKGPTPFINEPTQATLLSIEYYHACQADPEGQLPRDRRVILHNALISKTREQAMSHKADMLPLMLLASAAKGKR